MTLDLSRVPHLEARKRLGDLLDQREAIADEHAKLLEPKVAAIDAEMDALKATIGDEYRVDRDGDILVCKATGFVLFENDAVLHDHRYEAVCLLAALPDAVAECFADTDSDHFADDEEDDDAEAA